MYIDGLSRTVSAINKRGTKSVLHGPRGVSDVQYDAMISLAASFGFHLVYLTWAEVSSVKLVFVYENNKLRLTFWLPLYKTNHKKAWSCIG